MDLDHDDEDTTGFSRAAIRGCGLLVICGMSTPFGLGSSSWFSDVPPVKSESKERGGFRGHRSL